MVKRVKPGLKRLLPVWGSLRLASITNGEWVNDLALVLFCSEILQLVCFNCVQKHENL